MEQTSNSKREGGGGKRLDKDFIRIYAVPMGTDNRVSKGLWWGGKTGGEKLRLYIYGLPRFNDWTKTWNLIF